MYKNFLIKILYNNFLLDFPFESCYDYGSQPVGNCTVLYNAGAIGAESVNHVLIKNGYLDYGPYWSGCPFKNNTCPTGFSYYGWVMFKAYPETCDDYGVIASTEVFNIHLLGNGHLAVYAWLPSGTEYYAETIEPMMLNIFYPIVIQFQYFSSNNSWVLSVVAQSQLLGWALFGKPRTYVPPNLNLLFGGSGNGLHSHNATIQIDRTTLDFMPRDLSYIYQVTMDVLLRQSYCTGLYGVQTQSMTCYYVQRWVNLNWTNAYKTCEQNAFTYGYSYGRLAWFPPWNVSLWKSLEPRLAYYGNDSTTGYTAWIGGGKKLQWLDGSMVLVGVGATVPENITFEASNSTNSSCLQVDTRKMPWKWSETDCNKEQPFICQMSCKMGNFVNIWAQSESSYFESLVDCLVINPCKNLGVCLPHNDGTNICKCWPGTSGQFCEKGIPSVNCVNNCTCPSPFPAVIISKALSPLLNQFY